MSHFEYLSRPFVCCAIMNPACARCKKTVYPMEKLSCLDKVSEARASRTIGVCERKRSGCEVWDDASVLGPVIYLDSLAIYKQA